MENTGSRRNLGDVKLGLHCFVFEAPILYAIEFIHKAVGNKKYEL
jgi:hypothetical protein